MAKHTPTGAQRDVLACLSEGRALRYSSPYNLYLYLKNGEGDRYKNDYSPAKRPRGRTVKALLRRGWIEHSDEVRWDVHGVGAFIITPEGERALTETLS